MEYLGLAEFFASPIIYVKWLMAKEKGCQRKLERLYKIKWKRSHASGHVLRSVTARDYWTFDYLGK